MVESQQKWPIKVVSLADAVTRRQPLLNSLEKMGLDYELFEAVDGRDGLSSSYDGMIDRQWAEQRMGRPLTNTEFGCALSHILIYKEVVEQDRPGAVVLEDDAEIGPLFKQFIEERRFDCHDFIQLDYGRAQVYRYGFGRRPLMEGVVSERLVCNSSLTTGYSLSSKAARYILDHALPLSLPADWPCDLRPLAPVIAVPRIVRHPPFETGHSHMLDTREGKARALKSRKARKKIMQNPKPTWLEFGHRFLARSLPREP